MTGAPVEVLGLTRRFGPVEAVRGLEFAVSAGELFGVVGPDGAGKTTLLRMLAGVLAPSAGDALVGGVSVRADPERIKPGLAYMSQRFGLYVDLTVEENLRFYADLYRVPRAERRGRLEQLYGFSGLGPFRDRLAGALSGGMKQKLGLSAALVHRPALLLLDEATFGVDPISRRDLWLIVHEMVAAGTTVIASTAYLDEAERCDRVLLLHQGARLGLDTPGRFQASLEGRVFRISQGPPEAMITMLRGHRVIRDAVRFGDAVHLITARGSDRTEVETALREAGFGAATLQRSAPSFEDVFIDRLAGLAHG